ncbi:MAG TPA: DALR domain-containing protein, partial [Candidatus Elarobacter sp.]
WKFAKPGEPQWESPWGAGRPGWHIECSAMARALLGVPFDIHGGGYDLIFPHHENEIAQSEALMPAPPMAVMWVHGGLLNFDGRKMSKSLGNFEPLSELLKRHDPLAIRLLFLQTGYRKPMNFTEESIAGATTALERLRRGYAVLAGEIPNAASAAGERAGLGVEAYETRFFDALDDDMNTAGALGVLFDLISGLSKHPDAAQREGGAVLLYDALQLFGIGPLFERPVERERPGLVVLDTNVLMSLLVQAGMTVDYLNGNGTAEEIVQAAIDARAAARKNKDFAFGDRLRDALAAEGSALKDSKDGTTWTAAAT